MKTNKIVWLAGFLLTAVIPPAFAQNETSDLATTLNQFSHMNPGDKNLMLSTMGVPDVSGISLVNIIAWMIFGAVGFVAFVYGKKMGSFKPMVIGLVLMVYPYFVTQTLWLYTVGVGLCVGLYFWRD